jgi:hypothetical protein
LKYCWILLRYGLVNFFLNLLFLGQTKCNPFQHIFTITFQNKHVQPPKTKASKTIHSSQNWSEPFLLLLYLIISKISCCLTYSFWDQLKLLDMSKNWGYTINRMWSILWCKYVLQRFTNKNILYFLLDAPF